MKINKFNGLVTKASEYALPPGAFQEFSNFDLTTPGQIEGRDGVEQLKAPEGLSGCTIVHITPIPGDLSNGDSALVFDSCGNVYLWPSDDVPSGYILCEDEANLTTENSENLETE